MLRRKNLLVNHEQSKNERFGETENEKKQNDNESGKDERDDESRG